MTTDGWVYTARHDSTLCSVLFFSSKSVRSHHKLVVNSIHTADADTMHRQCVFGILGKSISSRHKLVANSNTLRCCFNTMPMQFNSTVVLRFKVPGEVGESLDGLGNECEIAWNSLLRQNLWETKQTRRQDRWTEKPQEDARTDELSTDVDVRVTVTLSTMFSQRHKHLTQLTAYTHTPHHYYCYCYYYYYYSQSFSLMAWHSLD